MTVMMLGLASVSESDSVGPGTGNVVTLGLTSLSLGWLMSMMNYRI